MNHFEKEMTFKQNYLPDDGCPCYDDFYGWDDCDCDNFELGFDYPDEFFYDSDYDC